MKNIYILKTCTNCILLLLHNTEEKTLTDLTTGEIFEDCNDILEFLNIDSCLPDAPKIIFVAKVIENWEE